MKKYLSVFFFLQLIVLTSCTTDADDEGWNASTVCPESKRGTFTDERDGQVYKFTTIGKQVWMAQNLNYNAEGTFCSYEEDYCSSVMGRVYGKENASCPAGWHVPNEEEWYKMVDEMGGGLEAVRRLKTTYGWNPLNPGDDPNGTDDCGFGAVHGNNAFNEKPFAAAFLSYNDGDEYKVMVLYSYDCEALVQSHLSYGVIYAYVRCIKDSKN